MCSTIVPGQVPHRSTTTMRLCLSALFAIISSGRLPVVQSFVQNIPSRCQPWQRHKADDSHYGGVTSRRFLSLGDSLTNDFETFLNQCSIQSFMFLLKTLRDPHTILWVERFTEPAIAQMTKQANALPSGGSSDSRLLAYHGLAAINATIFPTWQTYFEKLLEQPSQSLLIESHTAWAPDYELEINPPSLCSRIISVREQLAKEWVKDLGIISNMGGLTLDLYWARLRAERDKDDGNSLSRPLGASLIFLEFDPMATDDYIPSPLRKGNFDLLCLLSTQAAVYQVLNDLDRQFGAEAASNTFLSNFYAARLESHFIGSKRYGMADSFLEELLHEPPRTLQADGGALALVDPVRLAELVLEARKKVVLEWQDIAKDVPNRHMYVKRKQLNLLMGTSVNATLDEPFQ